jgi:DNA-binding ferritin-like protein (Dps family)
MKNLIDLIIGAREDKITWHALQERAARLPGDYHFVYQKIQGYMMNFAGGDGMDIVRLLSGVVDLFEEAAASGRKVQDIIGENPAAFCDELIRGADTWTDQWRAKLNESIQKKLEG